ncbi:cation-translocating P-type ATPase [Paraburkholderia sp. Tr-20389]|uniref:cation-translocating P-type ATPase n=1 Tax=Paraburkholderia sp. Tr-20389 TaxID=2703903 RepID=UPI001F11C297|nr:cation-translocating P-type ATPase [Paraburkholderia sp. Tr-20389]MBN3752232.1 cation-translocating P-type ATPase [Paraburkholderia sp. Tr-20389]
MRREDTVSGLTAVEVAALQAKYGPNVVASSSDRLWWRTVHDVLTEPMFLLLLIATALYGLLGDTPQAVTLLAFVVAVVLLTAFQSHRTASVLRALRDLSAPRAYVLRDGKRDSVSAAQLVPGDIVFVEEGAKVPADGTLMEAHELSVDESLLTGESIAVDKSPHGTGGMPEGATSSLLFSGTMVVRGQGCMTVTAIGPQTQLGRIGTQLAEVREPPSPLQLEIRTFVRRFATLALIICAMLVLAYRWRTDAWLPGLLAGITLAISLLPEELPVIMTVFMALGARRIVNEGVLTRRLSAIETLGQTSVLCVDKTGTLTQNRMSVRALHANGEETWLKDGERSITQAFHELIEYLVLASEIEPLDPMERAFHEAGHQYLANTGRLHRHWSLVQEYALTPELPAMSHVWRTSEPGESLVACKGAPEAICALCDMQTEVVDALMARATRMAGQGLRVLGVAKARHAGESWPDGQRDFNFTFVGLVGLLDPVRPDVTGAIAECRAAGVRVVMITGDYPSTARAIATEVGIDAARVVTGAELAGMDDSALQRAIRDSNVFARVTPGQKLRLVEAFRGAGEVVAMTGDGVNDAPALKAAHIGIAMGRRGAEVAREVASLVLLRDDFAPIVSAIRLGRRIYDNLKQALSFTVAAHIPMVAAATIPILMDWRPMLGPVHIVALELIITPVCSIVFENEREKPTVMQERPRRVGERLMTNRMLATSVMLGCAVGSVVVVAYAMAFSLGFDAVGARTVAFPLLVLGNLGIMFGVRLLATGATSRLPRDANPYGWAVAGFAVIALALLLTIPTIATVFGVRAVLAGLM